MAKPIVDMFSWNAPGNTLQDLYDWYLGGGDEDTGGGTGGTGGITNVYTGGGGGDAAEDLFGGYLQNPISPVALGAYGEPGYVGGLSGDVTQVGPGRGLENLSVIRGPAGKMREDDPLAYAGYEKSIDDPLAYGTDDEEQGIFSNAWNWARDKWGALPAGVQKTGKPLGIGTLASLLGASTPVSALLAGLSMLPKGEGYAVGGLDEHEKGLYNTLAADDLLFKDPGTGAMKDIRGKHLYSFADDYKEGLEDEYNKFMEKYNGRKNFNKLLAEGKIKNKYHINTAKVYDSVFTNYLDVVRTAKAPPGILSRKKDAPDTPDTPISGPDYSGVTTAKAPPRLLPTRDTTPISPRNQPDPPSGATPGSMGMSTYGGGDPFFNKGGRVGYGKGGIVDLL